MSSILIEGDTLKQYLDKLLSDPDSFRPEHCPYCGKGGLWHHGHYLRYPDRQTADHESLNPVPILRFHPSSLRQDMLMSACVHGAKAVVFMGHATCCSAARRKRPQHRSDQPSVSACAAHDWALEPLAHA